MDGGRVGGKGKGMGGKERGRKEGEVCKCVMMMREVGLAKEWAALVSSSFASLVQTPSLTLCSSVGRYLLNCCWFSMCISLCQTFSLFW